jgi:hypothetical protein
MVFPLIDLLVAIHDLDNGRGELGIQSGLNMEFSFAKPYITG